MKKQQKTKQNRTTFLNHTILAHVLCHQVELPPNRMSYYSFSCIHDWQSKNKTAAKNKTNLSIQ